MSTLTKSLETGDRIEFRSYTGYIKQGVIVSVSEKPEEDGYGLNNPKYKVRLDGFTRSSRYEDVFTKDVLSSI